MNHKLIKSIISVSGIVILAKLLGFVKQVVTANAFGATLQTDMIAIAEGIISNMDYLLVTALSTAFVPTYIHLSQNNNTKERELFVSDTIKVFSAVTIVIAVIFFTASPFIATVLAPNYTDNMSSQLASYIRTFAPAIIIIVEMSIFNSLLKANQSFTSGELVSFNQSVILISLVIMFGEKVGPDILVYAFYAYALFNLFFLMTKAHRFWHISSGLSFLNPHVMRLLSMMAPLLLGYSVVFVNQQVDKIIVSGMVAGTITAMNYASVLSNFVATFIGSITGVLFTYITKNIAEGKEKEAADLTTRSSAQIITVCIPITIITIMNATDIVTLVFGRGKFDNTAIENCSLALMGYAFMFIPFTMRELYSRFQYGYGDSKRPMINSTIAIVTNIILSIILSRFMGVLGVTIATSISVGICGFLNFYTSRKRNRFINWNRYTPNVPRWILGSICYITISAATQEYMRSADIMFRLITTTITSLLVFVCINKSIIQSMTSNLKK